MKTKCITIFLAGVLLVINPLITQAQEARKAADSFKISVKIFGDQKIKNLVKSYIGRELRSLKDVEITDNNPDWVLHLVTVETRLKEGIQTGFGISGIILKPFKTDVLTPLLDKRFKDRGQTLTADLYSVKKHMINIGSTDDIQNICKRIVADLDGEYIDIGRKKKN